MDNNRNEDQLEELFNRKFNEERTDFQETSWNVPSDRVWVNIEKELLAKKKPNRILFIWRWSAVAATVLLLISFFINHQYSRKIQALTSKLNDEKPAVTEYNNDTKYQSPKEKIINNTVVEQETSPTNDRISSSNILGGLKQPIISKTDSSKVSAVFDPGEDKTTVEETVENPSLVSFPIRKLMDLQKLPSLVSTLNSRIRGIDKNLNVGKVLPGPKASDFYLAMDYGPLQQSEKRNRPNMGRFGPQSTTEHRERSFTTGILLGWNMGKNWALETGFRYYNSRVDIRHQHTIPFDQLEEQLNFGGQYESTVSLRGNSSAGALETNVVLSRNSDITIPDNTNLSFDLSFSHQLVHFDIPIVLKRSISIGAFDLSLNAGMINRIRNKRILKLKSLNVDDPRFIIPMPSNQPNSRINPTPTNYTPYYLIGAGLAYNIDQKWGTYIDLAYTKSFQPLIEFDEIKVFSENTMLNIGIRYQL